jgi:polyhydroxyalkanoate synthesis regulator phasin
MPPAKRSPSGKSGGSSSSSPRTGTASAAPPTSSTVRSAARRTSRAAGGDAGIPSVAEQLARGLVSPRDLVMLTRDRIQETLDDAAARGRVTRKDANDLVSELVRRGRSERDDLRRELETLVERGREQLETATRRAVGDDPVDRIVRGADRARRSVGVGSAFPILGYDDLTARQIQGRLRELSQPELRRVLDHERRNANRKSVVTALERAMKS